VLRYFIIAFLLLTGLVVCRAETQADYVFFNGEIIRFKGPHATALAVTGERISQLGTDQQLKKSIGEKTKIIDLKGRSVIPGLIDSHIHAIRAGLTENTELSWTGITSIKQALKILAERAESSPREEWLIVAGGWVPQQFDENRSPSLEEIENASQGHPTYIQRQYSAMLLNASGADRIQQKINSQLASQLINEVEPSGHETGWFKGSARAITDVYNLLPKPDLQHQIEGTSLFFKRLNQKGITGVIDPGGYNLAIEDYRALNQLFQQSNPTLRVAYSLSAPRSQTELQDFQHLIGHLPLPTNSDFIKFNGFGENVTWGMYNNVHPAKEDKEHLKRVLQWIASQGITASFHCNFEESVGALLDVLEQVNLQYPLEPLRWSIAHLNNASASSLYRMKKIGIGWLVQNATYWHRDTFIEKYGENSLSITPPIANALAINLPLGAGTDAHRVMGFDPFVAIQWLVDGKSINQLQTRDSAQLIDRLTALKLYTLNNAWFAHDELNRGELETGKLADLVVLDRSYLEVPVSEIHQIKPIMTMLGGRLVFSAVKE